MTTRGATPPLAVTSAPVYVPAPPAVPGALAAKIARRIELTVRVPMTAPHTEDATVRPGSAS